MSGNGAQIPVFDWSAEAEDIDSVLTTLRGGWWSMGPRVEEFEQAFAAHLGVRHVVATSSCTTALHLSMLAAGVGPGDEVIVPSFTFVATAAAVLQAGGTPVFADVEGQKRPCIDPLDVEAKITGRTKAVVAVHYAGYPASPTRLAEICREHDLRLIEDCAHSPSAEADGRKLGSIGFAGCFSFFSNKVLACGEGGALSTDDDEVAEKARLLRSQGMTAGTMEKHSGKASSYDVVATGFNYRMDELTAALLLPRFGRLEAEIELRRALVRSYRKQLDEIAGMTIAFADEDVSGSSCYVMAVMIEGGRRDGVRSFLAAKGVQTTVHYPSIHLMSAYRERFPGISLPRTERASETQLCLPLHGAMTDEDLGTVSGLLEEALA